MLKKFKNAKKQLKELSIEVIPKSADFVAETGDDGKLNAGGFPCVVGRLIIYKRPK
ncbi:hypothetical protein [Pseudoalteromonas sp. NBT06-2]|uniref:hypothetical protein n=1 Tax=Pseudoalteromonas sp. NBT06-2 TaxID=2025950 RepID=UPI0014828C8C|nr:hypothetical protein [Pseudoalteromonas sp. NBT06-2]